MRKFGVQSIMDYSVESDSLQNIEEKAASEIVCEKKILKITENEFDKIIKIFLKCVDTVANATKREGFAAIKLTALGRPQLFTKYSEMIVQLQTFFKAITGSTDNDIFLNKISKEEFLKRLEEFQIKIDNQIFEDWFKMLDTDEDGFIDYYDWEALLNEKKELIQMFTSFNVRTGKVEPLIQQFTEIEEQEFSNMMDRLLHLADYAKSAGVGIMIDAEQTYYQPAISRIVIDLMKKYNQDSCQIMNTYQAYLKKTLSTIEHDLRLSQRENFYFGCKLVRGAYMEEESKRAADRGYENPINPSYEATNEMYNKCLERIIKEHHNETNKNKISVMVASHNEESIRKAIQILKDEVIAPSENVIYFAQLYGMCDQISFSLGQAGYPAFKYVPYGPVEEVLPYLSRRALENGSMLQNLAKERKLLWKELKRRLLSGQIIHRVPIA
uniref:Proline dehydrogenase n=1 Tax=Panagrolaimus davidi TaxID=227884 RepID=A0A914QCJ2_9BILA